jgi:PHD/YefM family antitoxin component YafN of YafNO toxin-antitoxin module
MTPTDTQFVTDHAGHRVAVLIGLDRYRQLLDALEELDAIRAYDDAIASGDEAVPFEEALREIERDRSGA